MRVGLNAGEVVVRAIGNDLHMDYSAIGQTTHLAARMEQMAMPGSILITPAVPGAGGGVRAGQSAGTGARQRARRANGGLRAGGCERHPAALAGGSSARAHALCRPGHGNRGPGPGPGACGSRPGQVVAVVGEAGGWSPAWCTSVSIPPAQGWLVLESASVSYGKATPYFPVIDLLKRYVHIEDADEPRTIRARVTGQVLTLDESLQETIPALLWLLDALPDDSPFRTLDPPQRRQRLLDALRRVLLRESQVQPCCWSLRICTGSIPRRRPCSTVSLTACPPPASCCWSTTGPNTSTAGVIKPPTRNCGSIRCRRRALTRCSRRCWGTIPA